MPKFTRSNRRTAARVSSRFSYSDPPLQQMPSRDPELGPLIRNCFLPEQGEVWAKSDVSQQEFRFVVDRGVHFKLPGAKEAGDAYRNDPSTDFHAMVGEMTDLGRGDAKAANFAKLYGIGVKAFAAMIGKSLHDAQAVIAQYDAKLPFVSRLSAIAQERAERIGYTELYDGARRHWNLYEVPRLYAKGAGPCSLEEATRRKADPQHPWYCQRIQRAHIYTALNALIQGSAARHTKLWMRAVWREGIVPMLQMHDALECSVASREEGELIARLGCEAVKLAVPMRVDLKFGRSWGDAKHEWDDLPVAAKPTIVRPVKAPTAKPSNVIAFVPASRAFRAEACNRDPGETRNRAPHSTAIHRCRAPQSTRTRRQRSSCRT